MSAAVRSDRHLMESKSFGTVAVLMALSLSVAAALYLLLASSYSGSVLTTFQDSTGLSYATTREVRQTLLEVNGWSALGPILFPVAVCAAVLATRASGCYRVARLIGAVILLAFTVVAGFSIGLFYAPSAVAMLLAVRFR
jgi:hypothetical protein